MHPTDGLGFTDEHIHELITYVNTHPAAFRENTYVLDMDIDGLKTTFNAEAMRTLDQIPFKKPRDRKVMENALLIKDIRTVYADEDTGTVFIIPFNNNIGIFGLTDGDGNCKILLCAYTLTDIKNLTILTGLILGSFMKALVPGVDVTDLVDELKSFSEGNAVRNGVRFSLFQKGNLFWYSAVNENAPVQIGEDD